MKKFWKKYRFVIIVTIAVFAFVTLSILTEGSSKIAGYDEFKENFSKNEYSVTVIGLTYCTHCKNFRPIIRKLAKDYDFPLYWLDIDALPEEDSSNLYNLFSEHGYDGSSPYIAVANKGQVIANHTGEMDKSATLDFLKESGIIK